MAGQEQIKRVYGTNGKCATLTTCQGGHREPKVFEKIAEPVNIDENGKAHTLKAQYFKNGMANFVTNGGFNATAVAEPVCVAQRGRYDENGKVYQHYEAQPTGKTNNLTTVSKDNLIAEPVNITKDGKAGTLRATCYKDGVRNLVANTVDKKTCVALRVNEPTKAGGSIDAPIYEVKDGFITVKGNQYPIKLADGLYIIRKLTVRECMRLQTVPEWYEWPVSKSQAYKMLGNGWTVDVIAHLLRGLK